MYESVRLKRSPSTPTATPAEQTSIFAPAKPAFTVPPVTVAPQIAAPTLTEPQATVEEERSPEQTLQLTASPFALHSFGNIAVSRTAAATPPRNPGQWQMGAIAGGVIQRSPNAGSHKPSSLQRQYEFNFGTIPVRDPSRETPSGIDAGQPQVQRKCAACEEEDEQLMRKVDATAVQREAADSPPATGQTAAADTAPATDEGADEQMRAIAQQLEQQLLQQLVPETIQAALGQIDLSGMPISDNAPNTGDSGSPATNVYAKRATTSVSRSKRILRQAAPQQPDPPSSPGASPPAPRPASAGTFISALTSVPEIKSGLATLQTLTMGRFAQDWSRLRTGERIGLVSTTVVIGAGTLTGVLMNPDARRFALDQLNGRVLPVPGAPWLHLELNTGDNNLMMGMHLDVGRFLPQMWGFGPSSPSAIGGPPQPEPLPGQRMIQRQEEGAAEGATENIAQQIQAASGSGGKLDEGVQQHLEQHLGADLSDVRIHTDSEADRLSRSVNAVAFTTGQDIFFSAGSYNPTSKEGQHLIAHEVVHTVQQANGAVAGTPTAGGVSISDPSDAFEQEAEQVADQVVTTSTPIMPSLKHGVSNTIQRDSTPAPAPMVNPPSPPPPGSSAPTPNSKQETDDGLVYIRIPEWTLIPAEEQKQNLVEPFKETIQLAEFPISIDPPLQVSFEISGHFSANFLAGIGPVKLTDVAIGMTKSTAIVAGAAVSLLPTLGPGPLLLALKGGHAHGFAKLDARGFAEVNVSAGVAISGGVTPLKIPYFKLAKATMGVEGSLGARLEGLISSAKDAKVDFAFDGGHLRFQREKELTIAGGLKAALTGYVEGSLLGDLITGRFSKTIGINKGFEWTPTGKMNLSFDNGLSNKDKIINVTQEDIKRAGKLINDVRKVLSEDKPTGDVSSSIAFQAISHEVAFEDESHYLEATNKGGGGNPCEVLMHSPGPGLYFEPIVRKDKSALQDEQKQLEDQGDALNGPDIQRLKNIRNDIATLDGVLLRINEIPSDVKNLEEKILKGVEKNPEAEREALQRRAKQMLDGIVNDFRKVAVKRKFKHLTEHYEKFPKERYLPSGTDIRKVLYEGIHSGEWKTARSVVISAEKGWIIQTVEDARTRAIAGDRSDWDEMQIISPKHGHGLIKKGASINTYDPKTVDYEVDHIKPVSELWNSGDYDGSDGQRETSFTRRDNLRLITDEANGILGATLAPKYRPFVGPKFTSRVATSREFNGVPFLAYENGPPLQW